MSDETTMTARDAWLAGRRTGLGGSDAAAAVGMSKWKTPLQLYMEKIGESEVIENDAMRWGTILEPVVRQEYANRTGRTVVTPGQLRHPSKEFLFVNADGIADACRLYEGKTARTADGWGEPGTDEVPDDYVIQCQHGMGVLGLEVTDLAVLIGGSDFRIYTIEADHEMQRLLFEQEEAFWVNHVLARVPPRTTTPADIRRRWRVSSGRVVTAEPSIAKALSELANVKATVVALEDYADNLAGAIQSQMADAEAVTDDAGKVLATWKNINASPRFNLAAFKESHPDLYDQFLTEAGPQRRFLTKLKGTPCLQQSPIQPPLIPAE